jgi:hypothetical protein
VNPGSRHFTRTRAYFRFRRGLARSFSVQGRDWSGRGARVSELSGAILVAAATPAPTVVMTEQMTLRGTLKGHNGWVTQIATTPQFPDMILSASRGTGPRCGVGDYVGGGLRVTRGKPGRILHPCMARGGQIELRPQPGRVTLHVRTPRHSR